MNKNIKDFHVKEEDKKINITKSDEDDDQKFIKKDSEDKSAEVKDNTQIDNICDDMQSDIKKNKDNLEDIAVKKKKERNLGTEVGGLEQDYEEIQEESNDSIEFGSEDLDLETGGQGLSEEYKAFIHKKKKGKGKGGKKMGKMTLTEKSMESLSYVERVKKLKQDRTNENKDGQSMLC
jgi:hypothetical protein